MSDTNSSGRGCSCTGLIVTILVLWALWFGLPTPWGTYNIDIFWPAIRRTDAPPSPPQPVSSQWPQQFITPNWPPTSREMPGVLYPVEKIPVLRSGRGEWGKS